MEPLRLGGFIEFERPTTPQTFYQMVDSMVGLNYELMTVEKLMGDCTIKLNPFRPDIHLRLNQLGRISHPIFTESGPAFCDKGPVTHTVWVTLEYQRIVLGVMVFSGTEHDRATWAMQVREDERHVGHDAWHIIKPELVRRAALINMHWQDSVVLPYEKLLQWSDDQ